MSQAIRWAVEVYDSDTGQVVNIFVGDYGSQYGWEVVAIFNRLGEQFARILDPTYE